MLKFILKDKVGYAEKVMKSKVSREMKKKLLKLALRKEEDLINDFIVAHFKPYGFNPLPEHKEIEIPGKTIELKEIIKVMKGTI